MTVYTHIEDCLKKLGYKPEQADTGIPDPKKILQGFKELSAEDRELLKIVFGEPDETALASKISKHMKYLRDGGDETYLFGTQPRTQQAYLYRSTTKPIRMAESASIVRQTYLPIRVTKEDKALLREMRAKILEECSRDYIDARSPDLILRKLLEKITEDAGKSGVALGIIVSVASCIDSLLETSEDGTLQIKGNILKSEEYQSLSFEYQYFVREVINLLTVLGYLSQDISEEEITVPLLPNEANLVKMSLDTDPDNSKVRALREELRKAETANSKSIWSTTTHGNYIDSKYQSRLGSKKDGKPIFPYEGTLYEYDEKNRKMVLASTQKMEYKHSPKKAALIITLDGQIHTFNHTGGSEADTKKFHSMITDGKSVLFAGSIEIDSEGKIAEITDTSGHYRPRITLELMLFLDQHNLLHHSILFTQSGSFIEHLNYTLVKIFRKPSTRSYIDKYFKENGFSGLMHLIGIVEKFVDKNYGIPIISSLIEQYTKSFKLTDKQLTRINSIKTKYKISEALNTNMTKMGSQHTVKPPEPKSRPTHHQYENLDKDGNPIIQDAGGEPNRTRYGKLGSRGQAQEAVNNLSSESGVSTASNTNTDEGPAQKKVQDLKAKHPEDKGIDRQTPPLDSRDNLDGGGIDRSI